MKKQLSLFDHQDEAVKQNLNDTFYQKWKGIATETVICEGTKERRNVVSDLRWGMGRLWDGVIHRCEKCPDGIKIWLNEIEPPEFWVLNNRGEVDGELIETCPFCDADLKNGFGDVIAIKSDEKWWRINGFEKQMSQEEEDEQKNSN